MSDLKEKYIELNYSYQRCLNNYYDAFLDGKDVDFTNVCDDILEEMKKTGDFYANAQKALEEHLTQEYK